MIVSRRMALLPLYGLAAALCGCPPSCPETAVSVETLVEEYNENASSVPRLWARAKVAVTLTDEKGRSFSWGSTSPLATPNALLLLGKGPEQTGPHDFVLIGRETAAVELFRLGSNVDEGVYYLWYRFGEHGQAWFGRHEYAGAPGVEQLPLDPNQLVSVLSVSELPDDFTTLPVAAMTLSRDPCAYVVSYIDRQPVTGKILFRREVYFRWSDDRPRRPFRVNLFDNNGDRVMTAELDRYRPVGDTGRDDPPEMPTDIRISWPQRRSSVHLVLSDMTAEDRWSRKATGFRRFLPGDIPITQVDAHLEARGVEP
ncbi:MAG: hypothetical protein ACLFVW_06715 [Phycisphaerae bacterium]